MQTPPDADPLGAVPLYSQQAGGTHPTRIHTCSFLILLVSLQLNAVNVAPVIVLIRPAVSAK